MPDPSGNGSQAGPDGPDGPEGPDRRQPAPDVSDLLALSGLTAAGAGASDQAGSVTAGGGNRSEVGRSGAGGPEVDDGLPGRMGSLRSSRRIPEATVARLPVYLRCLLEVLEAKVTTISSERLAEMAGVNAAKVRKDLSYLGSYGTRGVGYDVEYLFLHINRVLGLTQDWPVVIVGVGNLGHALANYRGFSARGFRIVALVDADRRRVGEKIGDITVRHTDELPEIGAEQEIAIGIIATPAQAAQAVADKLVAAGVRSILNFAPAVITVPPGVSLRKVDLSIELQILAFYQQRRVGDDPSSPPVATYG
jgi:redox-sensing transcriptional repressor